LGSESPDGVPGDLAALKSATVELDEATKPLADVVMDHAAEAMLKQRGILG
jgi:hypothetical protein